MVIKNESLKIFLQTVLNKSFSEISNDDLSSINLVSLKGDFNKKINFQDLNLFSNLKELMISDAYISNDDMKKISEYANINKIFFGRCMFEKGSLLLSNSVLELELVGCYIEDYSFLQGFNSLKNLIISNPYTEDIIDLKYLSNMTELKKLVLDRCLLNNFDCLTSLKELETLSLLWDSLPSNYGNIFNNMSKLKQLYIPARYSADVIDKSIIVKNDLNDFAYDVEVKNNAKK